MKAKLVVCDIDNTLVEKHQPLTKRTREAILALKEKGVAVIFVGEDLDVLIELCDRIMVIGSGKVTGIVDGRSATKEEIGLLMTKTESMYEKEEQ